MKSNHHVLRHRPPHARGGISRRSCLKMFGALAGGMVLDGCGGLPSAPTAAHPTPLTPWPAATPARVAIAQAAAYDPPLVRRQLEALLDDLGGVQDVVRPGDKVAIKVNLTGGVNTYPPPAGTTPPESYVTHPAVARAVGELLRDAGAGEIHFVESVYEWASYENWGYTAVARDLGAGLIDLNGSDPYSGYASIPVGDDWFIYEKFTLNGLLAEADVLVSVAKMKCHWTCGITQSMKNLIGLAPLQFHELKSGDGYRTGFHGSESEAKYRLPRVVLDLNRARRVNLSIIDGIKTVEGSEGPWYQNMHAISPGLLIGGKNPVATDSVAVAAMGFDPAADFPDAPFLRADNHLNIASRLGLGPNNLADIEILGANLDDVKMEFQPAWPLEVQPAL